MDLMFRYHIKSPWFNEKYNPSTPFVNLRLRVRRDGWKGLIDKFLLELEEGKHDPAPAPEPGAEASTDGKVPRSDDPGNAGDAAVNPNDADEKTEERGDEELPSPVQENRDNGLDDGVETATMVGDTNGAETKFEKPDLKDRIEPAQRDRNKDDEITVEPEGNQVLIRTIPPDIGRVKLEKVKYGSLKARPVSDIICSDLSKCSGLRSLSIGRYDAEAQLLSGGLDQIRRRR